MGRRARAWTFAREFTTGRHARLRLGSVEVGVEVLHHDYPIHEHGDRWVIRPSLVVDVPHRLTRRKGQP